MAKHQPPKRLFKPDGPNPSIARYPTSSIKLMKRVSRDHLDVLQNMEFTIHQCYLESPKVDDDDVSTAVRCCIKGSIPETDRAAMIAESLASIRSLREDVADDAWNACLRVVDDSIGRHSSRAPGDRGYLRFIADYV